MSLTDINKLNYKSKHNHTYMYETSYKHNYIYRIFTKNGVIYLKKSNRDLFEYMFNIICSQQLTTKAAKNIWKKVSKKEVRE